MTLIIDKAVLKQLLYDALTSPTFVPDPATLAQGIHAKHAKRIFHLLFLKIAYLRYFDIIPHIHAYSYDRTEIVLQTYSDCTLIPQ